MSSRRTKARWIIGGVAALLVCVVIVDALDLLDDKTWTEISHGNHSHFVPYDKDADVSVSDCPQQPPGADELLSSQCQMLSIVVVGETSHYIPADRNPLPGTLVLQTDVGSR